MFGFKDFPEDQAGKETKLTKEGNINITRGETAPEQEPVWPTCGITLDFIMIYSCMKGQAEPPDSKTGGLGILVAGRPTAQDDHHLHALGGFGEGSGRKTDLIQPGSGIFMLLLSLPGLLPLVFRQEYFAHHPVVLTYHKGSSPSKVHMYRTAFLPPD